LLGYLSVEPVWISYFGQINW